MALIDALQGPVQHPASGTAATAAVVLLHGYGSDGNDLIGLAPYYARALPQAVFYAPDAPLPLEGGFGGRQWFSLRNYNPELGRQNPQLRAKFFEEIAEDIQKSATKINLYLDQILTHHKLPASRLVLVGFSQGTMMSLQVGLRREHQLAGIVAHSGELIAPDKLAAEIKSKPPVVLIHGTDDPVIPYTRSEDAEKKLTALGISCQIHIIPGLQHGIDAAAAQFGAKFMQSVIGEPSR